MKLRRPATVFTLALAFALAGCGATSPATEGSTASTAPEAAEFGSPVAAGRIGRHVVDGRPFEITVPSSYDAATPAPLIMLLHGHGSNGPEVDGYAGLRAPAAERGALYVVPEGTTDSGGLQFWNASTACCDFSRSGVDDSGYLAAVLRAVAATYAVDASRVMVFGHSNGGFMAYRMACDHADLVTHAVSLAGAMPAEGTACSPSAPVSVLQVHGTADSTIRYDGGSNGPYPYPSALDSAEAWARFDGCATHAQETSDGLDLDSEQPGADTSITAFSECDDGARVELWSIDGAGHVPALGDDFPDALLDFAWGGS